MYISPIERLGLFIDGANLHATARALGFELDFKRLLAMLREKGRLLSAHYYTTLIQNEEEFCSIRPLIDWLDYNGFTTVTKPVRQSADPDARRTRGKIDVELAVDAMRLQSGLDHVLLFSGNGDFKSLVSALQELGKRVSVVSTLATQPAMIADELRRQADQFIDLVDLQVQIGRTARARVPPSAEPRG
jgi:uncharacterized LabA/DUF88 family protein